MCCPDLLSCLRAPHSFTQPYQYRRPLRRTDAGGWRENHTLTIDAYGIAGHGSWVLLEPTQPPTSPILGYKSGKYLEGGRWVLADRLLSYTAEELAEAREKAIIVVEEASRAAVEAELYTGGHSIGSRVFAKGLAPSGEREWFVSKVVGHRSRFPPIVIEYMATHPEGETSSLALPVPRRAYVSASHVCVDSP